jgi:4a-hydroxytetrahydrobiopterin dehydratase
MRNLESKRSKKDIMSKLNDKRCKPCEGGVPPLNADQIKNYLKELPQWTWFLKNSLPSMQNKQSPSPTENNMINTQQETTVPSDGDHIYRDFEFKNYYKTMAFVNAVAWIAHQENHHPDLFVGYNRCRVQYTTHAIAGLSENDFICAAKVDALINA